jgi:restriction system protein
MARRRRSSKKGLSAEAILILVVAGSFIFLCTSIGSTITVLFGGATEQNNFVIGLTVILCAVFGFVIWQNYKNAELMRSIELSQIDNMEGVVFEGYLVKLLESRGFSAENIRASNDFGVDIIARMAGDKIAIQAKRYSKPISRIAISDAVAGMKHYGCNRAMVITNTRFTKSALEFANSTGCELVDRDKLAIWINEFSQKNLNNPQVDNKIV